MLHILSTRNKMRRVYHNFRKARAMNTGRCPHMIFDQLGFSMCMRNPDAPGECAPDLCPYGLKEES